MFNRHFKEWWKTGRLIPGENLESTAAFSKIYEKNKSSLMINVSNNGNERNDKIECVCALAVSPAAASKTYAEKRDHWKSLCYEPGLKDYETYKSTKT